jgi:hypothetical protein
VRLEQQAIDARFDQDLGLCAIDLGRTSGRAYCAEDESIRAGGPAGERHGALVDRGRLDGPSESVKPGCVGAKRVAEQYIRAGGDVSRVDRCDGLRIRQVPERGVTGAEIQSEFDQARAHTAVEEQGTDRQGLQKPVTHGLAAAS